MKASIAQHGVEWPTIWDDEGNLLDGWERESICAELGVVCPREVRHFESESDKFRFVLAMNAHRRPALSQKQKREVIASYLKGDPEVADNALGESLGVSKNTVLEVRSELESKSEIPTVSRTRGRDGKVRPVRYAKRIITNTPAEFEKAKDIIKELPDDCSGRILDFATAKAAFELNSVSDEGHPNGPDPLEEAETETIKAYQESLRQESALSRATAISNALQLLFEDMGDMAHAEIVDLKPTLDQIAGLVEKINGVVHEQASSL